MNNNYNMKLSKNNRGFLRNITVLLVVVISAFMIVLAGYVFIDLSNYRFFMDNKQAATKQLNTDEKEEQVPVPGDLSRAAEIIASLLTPEEADTIPEITVVKATDSHIKANLFYNPGGGYVLAAKIDGEWKKILEGNGIPKCTEINQYSFPADIVPKCMSEDGSLINNEWLLIKSAIANCQVKEVMQAHSLYVKAGLKDGRRLEGFEPAIDDIIRLALEAQGKCGKIIMATE